jgi:hypothetical protein
MEQYDNYVFKIVELNDIFNHNILKWINFSMK